MVRSTLAATVFLLIGGCANINIGESYNKPLKEQVVEEGDSASKILLVAGGGHHYRFVQAGAFEQGTEFDG
ncbi:hypothetical protein [Thiomicrorhabdus sp.]|uniref:hypothetical protein n=1 Tax=Thiomicrorhabdus sp. TaxID=2039724 RepID=UPI0029C7B27A|nr:hypothetical protein [Thiomicrorhabdus sp.]